MILSNSIIQQMTECPLCQMMFQHETKETGSPVFRELTLSLNVHFRGTGPRLCFSFKSYLNPYLGPKRRRRAPWLSHFTKRGSWGLVRFTQKWLTRVLTHFHLPWWWFRDQGAHDLLGVLSNHWSDAFLWNPSNFALETMLSCGRCLEAASEESYQKGGVTSHIQWGLL